MEGKGGEVVTRQPYRKVRLDHLLSKENKYPGLLKHAWMKIVETERTVHGMGLRLCNV